MLKLKSLLGAAAAVWLPALAPAAILTSVPMQGGMVMPMVSYQANDGRIHVMMPDEIPELIPLLVSHPGDSFDPSDPWYDSVDPSRQGESFSRRYGFVMDAMTDPLPAGIQMWIRKLSGSPELKAYRYRNTEPKAWEPIYGTAGVTNAMFWNGMMFHPAFTAPPNTNALTATFEVYLLDTASGLEVPNSSSGPLEFRWTNVHDGRPTLGIGQRTVVFWPANTTGWRLEGTEDLANGLWTEVTNSPVNLEGQAAVVIDPEDARKFFRMKLGE